MYISTHRRPLVPMFQPQRPVIALALLILLLSQILLAFPAQPRSGLAPTPASSVAELACHVSDRHPGRAGCPGNTTGRSASHSRRPARASRGDRRADRQ